MSHFTLEQALSMHQQGELDTARDAYLSVLKRNPKDVNALNLLGVLCCQQSRREEGVRYLRKCLQLRPDIPSAHNNLGNALAELGRYEEACTALKRALALDPDYAEGHFNLSVALFKTGNFSRALEHARKALAIDNRHANARLAEGMALHAMKQYESALPIYKECLGCESRLSAQAHYQIGRLYHDCGDLQNAFDFYRISLQIDSTQALANNDLGSLLLDLHRECEALEYFQEAIRLKKDFVTAWSNLGLTYAKLDHFEKSSDAHQTALALNPNAWFVQSNFAWLLLAQGRIDEAEKVYRKALRLNPQSLEIRSSLLFASNYATKKSIELLSADVDAYGRLVSVVAKEPFSSWSVDRVMDKKLRVGLVSGDLCQHPVGYFLASTIPSLDKSKIELVAYSTQTKTDALTERLKTSFFAWRSLLGLDDRVAASLIHSDQIDILIDLSGHCAANRLPLFAWKPAPIQMTWLGYFATTGVKQIDYVLTDPHVFSEDCRATFVEKPCFLPKTYFCFSQPEQVVEVSSLPAERNGYITFGCFSNLAKINEGVLDLWVRVLNAVPNARMLLKAKQLSNEDERLMLLERLVHRGVENVRITIEGWTNRLEYFERYSDVDIMLDTFPFPGGTTTAESLWMGVPVLTLRGETPLGRQGVSILTAAGMPGWVATTHDDYVAIAVSCAQNLSELRKLREGLREQVCHSPLMDAKVFARSLESAWQSVWNEWVASAG